MDETETVRAAGGFLSHIKPLSSNVALCGFEPKDSPYSTMRRARWMPVGDVVDAKTIDLRLWAAAALINSARTVSVETVVRRSLEEKLKFMRKG